MLRSALEPVRRDKEGNKKRKNKNLTPSVLGHLTSMTLNSFNTGIHFYIGIWVQLDHCLDIRKGLWRSED
ncbi:hypothetical protein E2C01_070700 [Portunus trituberculatus]|uniref:Uncharacterized protein n=1 Tax=Portunus trituberculatus TaxID=210409 RepID=A0A5B7HTE7_PORTR|nr:hypothetical protein [Portunus trituberculatus]